jgi:hypothetical protein
LSLDEEARAKERKNNNVSTSGVRGVNGIREHGGGGASHISTGSTKNDKNSSNSIVPLQQVSARMKHISRVGRSARRRKQPAIQINFDEHFNALLPAQHNHDLLERKLELVLHDGDGDDDNNDDDNDDETKGVSSACGM